MVTAGGGLFFTTAFRRGRKAVRISVRVNIRIIDVHIVFNVEWIRPSRFWIGGAFGYEFGLSGPKMMGLMWTRFHSFRSPGKWKFGTWIGALVKGSF